MFGDKIIPDNPASCQRPMSFGRTADAARRSNYPSALPIRFPVPLSAEADAGAGFDIIGDDVDALATCKE
jgi:hypothetical protein